MRLTIPPHSLPGRAQAYREVVSVGHFSTHTYSTQGGLAYYTVYMYNVYGTLCKKLIYFLLFELLLKALTLMEGHVEINQHSIIVIFHIDYFMMVFFTKVIKQAFWTDICTMQYSIHALQSSQMQACWMLDKEIYIIYVHNSQIYFSSTFPEFISPENLHYEWLISK